MDRIAFIADVHLGKLAKLLRMLGFDTLYRNTLEDAEIAYLSRKENRVVLTRDRELISRLPSNLAFEVQSSQPYQQLREVLEYFQLKKEIQPFKRCLLCNRPLKRVEKEKILSRLEPRTQRYYDEFYQCPKCQKIYWKGSHYEHMLSFINEITKQT